MPHPWNMFCGLASPQRSSAHPMLELCKESGRRKAHSRSLDCVREDKLGADEFRALWSEAEGCDGKFGLGTG